MAAFSHWLQIMLAEIARKQEELEQAREEELRRDREMAEATHRDTPTEGAGATQPRGRGRDSPIEGGA